MREIKFRAWDKDSKEIISLFNIDFEHNIINKGSLWKSLYSVELMQYTWLKDKNGKEIYEGDILKWKDSLWRLFVYPVTWCDDKSGFILDSENFSLWIYKKYKGFEIIGNVYENPELVTNV